MVHVNYLFHHCDKMPALNNLKEADFLLAHIPRASCNFVPQVNSKVKHPGRESQWQRLYALRYRG